MVNQLSTLFGECASTDGLLNEAGWLAFMKKHDELYESKGAGVMPHGESILKEAFANLKKWTPDTDGVSLTDFFWQQKETEPIMQEIESEFFAGQ